MGKQKTKSPQSQLSKTDTYEINQTFSFLQSDAYIEFADQHPDAQISSSEIARRKKAAKEYLPVIRMICAPPICFYVNRVMLWPI